MTADGHVDNVTDQRHGRSRHYLGIHRERLELVISGLSSKVSIEHFDANDVIHINGLGGDDVINVGNLGSNGPQIVHRRR